MDEKQFQPPYYYEDEDDGISMLDILIILAEHKKLILGTALIFLLCGLTYGLFFLKQEYVGEVQVMPLSATMTQKDSYNVFMPGNIVAGVATSNTIFDDVIDKFGLQHKDGKTLSMKAARKALEKAIKVKADDKTNVISITAKSENPKEAADMANYVYAKTLQALKDMAVISTVDNSTAQFESVLNKIIEKGGVKDLDPKSETGTARIVELYTTLTQYDDSKQLKNKMPVVLQLISSATVPDEKEPQGRGKIAALSAILGLFVGITLAFVSNFWQSTETDPETEKKKTRLRMLLGCKKQ